MEPYFSDKEGRPAHLQFRQYFGKLYFGWDDFSMCESAFAISRDGLPFISDLYLEPTLTCGEKFR